MTEGLHRFYGGRDLHFLTSVATSGNHFSAALLAAIYFCRYLSGCAAVIVSLF
jgi:hypothetical protein